MSPKHRPIPGAQRLALPRWAPAAAADEGGTVAVLFALALVPTLFLMGAAVDYARAIDQRAGLQRAVDAAVLAATRMNDPDDKREAAAERAFEGGLTAEQLALVHSKSFRINATKTKLEAAVTADVPSTFLAIAGTATTRVKVDAAAVIPRPQIRQLDLVFCIDGTGSMQNTLNAVKANALNFEASLNTELVNRGIAKFDAMRVRPIFFRDYGGNTWYDPKHGGWAYTSSGWRMIDKKDPDRERYVGDVPPLRGSGLIELPADRTGFSSFVQPENAWGGGDLPESGLECVNEAMDSPFVQKGDALPKTGKKLTGAYPVIVVWTDADAHPPAHPLSLSNPDYPPPDKMPRDYGGLSAKWTNTPWTDAKGKTHKPGGIDQDNKMLVFFGDPTRPSWKPLTQWGGFVHGGSLTEGTNNMVAKIADALASKVEKQIITH